MSGISFKIKIAFLILTTYSLPVAKAQEHIIPLDQVKIPDTTSRKYHIPIFDNGEVDLIDIGNGVLNKFPDRSKDTVHIDAGKLHSSLLPGIGYSIETNFEIELSYLGGFYTSNENNANQSSILATIIFTRLHQLLIPVVSSIWTKNNQYNLQTDWRYLVYPQETYGLGGYSSLNKGYILSYTKIRLYSSIYKVIKTDMYVGVGYDFDDLLDGHEIDPPPGITDFEKYNIEYNQKGTNEIASGATLHFLYDTRRNSINPSAGNFINISYRANLNMLGSSENWQSLIIDLRKYIPLSTHSKQVIAFWTYEWLTINGNPPYDLLPSIGEDPYSNTGRGFAQGRFRGKNMLYVESEYRFGILRNGLLGGVVFANSESFSEQTNNQFARIYAGYGAGIRIKFNKFSKTNVAFDYAFGTDGSKGIFLNLGEVF